MCKYTPSLSLHPNWILKCYYFPVERLFIPQLQQRFSHAFIPAFFKLMLSLLAMKNLWTAVRYAAAAVCVCSRDVVSCYLFSVIKQCLVAVICPSHEDFFACK